MRVDWKWFILGIVTAVLFQHLMAMRAGMGGS